MGKNRTDRGEKPKHSPSTVFVTGLPYSYTNSQLEESFSDVGPIRRCFMITKKGSTEHRGFGFVQFAVIDDANRAIELKNGSSVGGRKVTVKHATHRASLEQRRSKESGVPSADISVTKNEKVDPTPKTGNQETRVPSGAISETKNEKVDPTPKIGSQESEVPTGAISVKKNEKVDPTPKVGSQVDKLEKKTEKPVKGRKQAKLSVELADKETCSEKQRVARTVIFGGLVDVKMAEQVHNRAKGIGTVCSITYPLPEGELDQNGLAQDGCRKAASAVLFTSVKSACSAVKTLHQTEINGNIVWARQLGGEGSKAQKWKLIIRNLPFQAKPTELKQKFLSAGFVWDVYIPQNSNTGLSRGFGFVKFTCKKDAENAIQKFNGQLFGKRTIAVDWAVSKKLYNSGADAAVPAGDGKYDESDGDSDGSSVDLEEKDENEGESPQSLATSRAPEDSDMADVDFEEDADMARKVLNNLLASSHGEDSVLSEKPIESDKNEVVNVSEGLPDKSSDATKPGKPDNTKQMKPKLSDGDDLQRTLFISNLPFDIQNEEVTEKFAGFGKVQSFVPVLHPVTKRPRGTGFLRFRNADAVDAAISASNVASAQGIILKGRQLTVLRALNKKSAQDKELEKTQVENVDHRNLYLAKEGLILENTPAAEGVSGEDMERRQRLHESKMKKLQSPNFHVSRTRIVIYNLPKSMTEKQLTKLCIEAVTSRATKQKPSIRQIKFLQSVKKGKIDTKNYSRGVAFVEFTEHQHALVALRVLNNNPETFGAQHRPVVEFAVDNVQKLKIRKAKMEFHQKDRPNNHQASEKQLVDGTDKPDHHPKRKPEKRKSMGEPKPVENSKEDSSVKNKRQKNDKKPVSDDRKEILEQPPKNQKDQRHSAKARSAQKPNLSVPENLKAKPEKRKFEGKTEADNRMDSGDRAKRAKKSKEPAGRAVVDKLDLLIEQYRSKFSHPSSGRAEEDKQGSGRVRRWFQA